nr:hypothetical protein [Gilliamella sp. B14384G15]
MRKATAGSILLAAFFLLGLMLAFASVSITTLPIAQAKTGSPLCLIRLRLINTSAVFDVGL